MTTAKKLLSTQTGGDKLYVDDVFSTYLYTGNGSTQTINNGIDLAGEGGLVWLKNRSASSDHALYDTTRGKEKILTTSNTNPQVNNGGSGYGVTDFLSNGLIIGGASGFEAWNNPGRNYVSWTFRKSPKFFDVVTYTGNSVAGRQIPHSLGIEPGMVVVKKTDNTQNWYVSTRGFNSGYNQGYLNLTNAFEVGTLAVCQALSTDETFYVSAQVNDSGAQYVAYLFAHDPSADGIVQCGSFLDAGYNHVELGWEPQCLMVKNTAGGDWRVVDNMRSLVAMGNTDNANGVLFANSSAAESTLGFIVRPTATGFSYWQNNNNSTCIYLAIRRPNKPPKSGVEVYNAITRTGTGAAATVTGVGFAPDLMISKGRSTPRYNALVDKLRGVNLRIATNAVDSEFSATDAIMAFGVDGVSIGADASWGSINSSGEPYINHFFRRAPGFFDVVCYTGTGVARTVNHNLGVAPELMIVKRRDSSTYGNWITYASPLSDITAYLALDQTWPKNVMATVWGDTSPTNTTFSLGATYENTLNGTYVAYLFASLPGISKVGSYTGNGTSLSVECGFSTGARFILVKSINDAGDWFIWDTARGIVAANDPHLSLNTTAAEVTTDDSVDPYTGGFIVNQNTATNINISGKRYIFLAIA